MLRTITLGSYISIQGFQVGQATDGKITVRVDNKHFTGTPIESARKS